MREIVRPVLAALSVVGLAGSLPIVSIGSAFAQADKAAPKQQPPAQQSAPPAQPDQAPPLKQVALTDKLIDGAVAAAKEMDPITAKLPDDAKPDPKITAQLDAIAKKNGFAGFDEYNTVADNISLVLGGIDPKTRKYVGPEAVIKAQIAQVQADKKMPANDRKDALADLNDALKSPPPAVESKGNIELVEKYYDKLAEMIGTGDEK